MGPSFVPTFLYYFVGTTLIVAFVVANGSEELQGVNPIQIGLLFGLVTGGLGAYFNSNRTIEVPIKNRGAFLKQLNQALAQMGYQPTSELEAFTVYERPVPGKFFAGKLFIQIEKNVATLSGRSSQVKALHKRIQP